MLSMPALTWKLPAPRAADRIAGGAAFPSPSRRKACSTATRRNLGREQPLDLGAAEEQHLGHVFSLTGPPIARQAKWPPFM